MINIGDIIGDRYEIIDKIGSGGMSDVYKAICHKLNRYVAIKVLKQEFCDNDEFVYKFRVEAQAAAGLAHPNIVSVYDVGDEYEIHYIVMEWIDGFTLKKYIEKKQRLTIKETTSIAIEVSRAIAAAHNSGIIHRDIKPQNIMIGKDGKVKITDFGIAKATSSNTITGNVMGSVHYVSPEQARGGYSDAKSDIYSLGITLFEMITGRLPFNGDTTVAVAIKHIQDPFPNPLDFVPDLPRAICDIIMKCTQKNQDKRYMTMAELAEDLRHSMSEPDGDFVTVFDETSFDTKAAVRLKNNAKAAPYNYSQKHSRREPDEKESKAADDYYDDDADDYENYAKDMYRQNKVKRTKSTSSNSKSKQNNRPRTSNTPVRSTGSRRKKKNENATMDKLMTILTVIAAVLIAGIAFFIIARAFGLFESSAQESKVEGVKMPLVTGQSIRAAELLLHSQKILFQTNYEASDRVEKDLVISQSVEAGELVATDETVTLTVSQGSGKIEVPDVSGATKAQALIALQEKGFKVYQEEVFSADTAKGLVVYQDPEGNTLAKPGSDVRIFLSQGELEIKTEVPDVVGKNETAAKAEIERAGFICDMVNEEYSDTIAAGLVVRQIPEAKTTLTSGGGITIYLSLGPSSNSLLPLPVGQTYACDERVDAPLDYQGGNAVVKMITGAPGVPGGGTTLFNSTVTAFPVSIVAQGITDAAVGTITVDYEITVYAETTDEAGNSVTVPHKEARTARVTVNFKEER